MREMTDDVRTRIFDVATALLGRDWADDSSFLDDLLDKGAEAVTELCHELRLALIRACPHDRAITNVQLICELRSINEAAAEEAWDATAHSASEREMTDEEANGIPF